MRSASAEYESRCTVSRVGRDRERRGKGERKGRAKKRRVGLGVEVGGGVVVPRQTRVHKTLQRHMVVMEVCNILYRALHSRTYLASPPSHTLTHPPHTPFLYRTISSGTSSRAGCTATCCRTPRRARSLSRTRGTAESRCIYAA